MGTALKFRKRKKISSSLVYVLQKREIRHFHVVVEQQQQRNVQKSVMHVQSCCFSEYTYCCFDVNFAVAVVVAKIPYWLRLSLTHCVSVSLENARFILRSVLLRWLNYHVCMETMAVITHNECARFKDRFSLFNLGML